MGKLEGKKLRIAIPKGSLQEFTLRLFEKSGFTVELPPRRYILKIDDPEIECFLLRPQEIPRYTATGRIDMGISGKDWILETRADVIEVCDLQYAKTQIKKIKWVLAVPQDSSISSVKDLEGKTISTEILNIAKDYLKKHNVKAEVEFSWGATEVKPPLFSDAIIDVVETGSSLRAHNLKILDTVLESSTKLVANKKAWEDDWKRKKIEFLSLLLQSAIKSEQLTTLMLHVPTSKLDSISALLDESMGIAIRKLAKGDYYTISMRCHLLKARELIPKLKRAGGEDIVQLPVVKWLP